MGAYQIDFGQAEGLGLIADVIDAENALPAIHALAPEGENLMP